MSLKSRHLSVKSSTSVHSISLAYWYSSLLKICFIRVLITHEIAFWCEFPCPLYVTAKFIFPEYGFWFSWVSSLSRGLNSSLPLRLGPCRRGSFRELEGRHLGSIAGPRLSHSFIQTRESFALNLGTDRGPLREVEDATCSPQKNT